MRSLEHDDDMYIFGMQSLISSRIYLFMHQKLYFIIHIYTLNPKHSRLCYTSMYSSLPVLHDQMCVLLQCMMLVLPAGDSWHSSKIIRADEKNAEFI